MTTEQTTDEKSLQSINNAFKFYDFNSDGVIDKAELQRYFKSDKMVDGIVERLDKNKDGVISYSGRTPTPPPLLSPHPSFVTVHHHHHFILSMLSSCTLFFHSFCVVIIN